MWSATFNAARKETAVRRQKSFIGREENTRLARRFQIHGWEGSIHPLARRANKECEQAESAADIYAST